MGLERLRSHFPRETWMCVHSALRAADYGGALRAPFQQFRPTAGRHTANELTSVCHKSLLSHSATHRLVVRRRLIRYSQPHAWPHAKHTRHALGSHTQEGPGLRPCCQHGAFFAVEGERRRTIDGSRGATADDSAGARAGHCAARHGVRLVLHRRGPGPRGGARWLDLQVH